SNATVKPAALSTVVPLASQPDTTVVKPKQPHPTKLSSYNSHDYGVSFRYPWQYGFINARMVANGDASLKPKSDGHDGQFTLARVEIPQGFYPDTDFESGYFSLSLNQNLNEEQCVQSLSSAKDAKLSTVNIGGRDFRWIETSSGGKGSASKVRDYVAFENGACYELEVGVTTANQDGLSREVDPDMVLSRLDSILQTVKIVPQTEQAVAPVVETSKAAEPPATQK
ncbi:MAG TPA: hypothetical protein VKU02_26820, partial [Gemmataceae bacterium]|nr:hypothetical protein [Gemmataceae bacterium]